MLTEKLNTQMSIPSSDMVVLAIGETEQDKAKIYQVYLQDNSKTEFILQLFCNKDEVTEATLFKQVVNIVPLTEEEWDENMENIGNQTIELDDAIYNRVWGADSDARMDLVQFDEKVVESDTTTRYTNNYLLYSRTFESLTGDEETEMLLVGVEESEDTAEITMMVGLPLPASNINVQ